jgi:tRNA (guanine37-N1)-methyltransferase
MRFDVITLFPNVVEAYFKEGIVSQGIKSGLLEVNVVDLRQFGKGNYKQVDDHAFGDGAGMVLMFDPVRQAIESVEEEYGRMGLKRISKDSKYKKTTSEEVVSNNPSEIEPDQNTYSVVALTAKGEIFKQSTAKRFKSQSQAMILLCGRYEGFDQRTLDLLVDEEISMGNFVMSGGEIGAMAVIDSVSRLIPGVLNTEESFESDSFYKDDETIQYPQYTRPREIEYDGEIHKVPEVLFSGNHAEIQKWREKNLNQK